MTKILSQSQIKYLRETKGYSDEQIYQKASSKGYGVPEGFYTPKPVNNASNDILAQALQIAQKKGYKPTPKKENPPPQPELTQEEKYIKDGEALEENAKQAIGNIVNQYNDFAQGMQKGAVNASKEALSIPIKNMQNIYGSIGDAITGAPQQSLANSYAEKQRQSDEMFKNVGNFFNPNNFAGNLGQLIGGMAVIPRPAGGITPKAPIVEQAQPSTGFTLGESSMTTIPRPQRPIPDTTYRTYKPQLPVPQKQGQMAIPQNTLPQQATYSVQGVMGEASPLFGQPARPTPHAQIQGLLPDNLSQYNNLGVGSIIPNQNAIPQTVTFVSDIPYGTRMLEMKPNVNRQLGLF